MIDFGLLRHIADYRCGSGEAIHQLVACQVRAFGFRDDGEAAKPCYAKVASFLDDGWESQRRYLQFRDGVSPEAFGIVMNRLIGGHRFDQEVAARTGAPWLGAGSWPTKLDTAAFLYHSGLCGRGESAKAA